MTQTLKERISKIEGVRERISNELSEKEERKEYLEERKKDIEDALVLLQVTSQETQKPLKVHLEDIVQLALDTCYPGEYTFQVNFERKYNSTVCEMYLLDQDGFPTDPKKSNGGGMMDLLSFSLRLAVWTLQPTDNCLILDEPFKYLSEGLKPLAAEIMKELSTTLGIQIIMVTHDLEAFADIADKKFRVRKRKGISTVREI